MSSEHYWVQLVSCSRSTLIVQCSLYSKTFHKSFKSVLSREPVDMMFEHFYVFFVVFITAAGGQLLFTDFGQTQKVRIFQRIKIISKIFVRYFIT